MTLSEWVAGKKLAIFESLRNGKPPQEGKFDEKVWREALTKGPPQIGATKYQPHSVFLEYIFPDKNTSPTVLSVTLNPPERIVFLPVPSWVIETIWQGDVDGTFHFESEARTLVEAFGRELEPENNKKWFEHRAPTRRE